MKFSIGDKILLSASKEEGVVTAFLGKGLWEVRIKTTIIPVLEEDIEHPYWHWFTQKKTTKLPNLTPEIEKEKKAAPKVASGIFFHFLPQYKTEQNAENEIEHFRVYLINQTDSIFSFDYQWQSAQYNFKHSATAYSFQHFYLHNIPFEAFASAPQWQLKIKVGNEYPKTFISKLKPKQAAQQIEQMLRNNAAFIAVEVKFKTIPVSLTPLPIKISNKSTPATTQLSALKDSMAHVYVPDFIDLHAEALHLSIKNLSNTEILHLQLEACNNYLQEAISLRLSGITIVTGHGKGVLRKNVLALLQQFQQIKNIDTNWDRRFGFGALHVYF